VIVALNSYSLLQNKTSMLKKVSPTNQVVARIAVAPVNKPTMVAVSVAVVNNAKCMKLLVQLVAYKLKYRSVRAVTALYTAAIASVKTAVAVVTN
jgi:hypothetical protein